MDASLINDALEQRFHENVGHRRQVIETLNIDQKTGARQKIGPTIRPAGLEKVKRKNAGEKEHGSDITWERKSAGEKERGREITWGEKERGSEITREKKKAEEK